MINLFTSVTFMAPKFDSDPGKSVCDQYLKVSASSAVNWTIVQMLCSTIIRQKSSTVACIGSFNYLRKFNDTLNACCPVKIYI